MATERTLHEEALNVGNNIAALTGKLEALTDWEATRRAHEAGRVVMELRHGLEDALASVRKLEAAEEGD